jgi:hypothetical protein
VGAPPAQDAFSSLLLPAQGLESCCRIGDTSLDRKLSRHTEFYGKDADGGRREL